MAFENYIQDYTSSNDAKVAYGGYFEKRAIYDRSSHFKNKHNIKRNVHIGLDLWAPQNTSILAPLDGEIHSFKNNIAFGDYGPTIILQHEIGKLKFHTLYGHLTRDSISSLEIGQKINKGQHFCKLGSSKVNGDYAPHLHFQIVVDLQGKKGDYPGVVTSEDNYFYSKNCPNPMMLLKINDF